MKFEQIDSKATRSHTSERPEKGTSRYYKIPYPTVYAISKIHMMLASEQVSQTLVESFVVNRWSSPEKVANPHRLH